ncbi:Gfo/Idh/MocA family protein [Leeia sp.]|uniref:Gfo/Idh/MocA family protein n=1 Tax=Leeia sp. TaxID=2884678 RepID=UPI0035B45AE9
MNRIRTGMIGGGQGAFIGAVHRLAMRFDNRFDLLAGALSSQPERARQSGLELGLAPERCYDSHQAMLQGERGRADGIEAVVIVTPNHLHFAAVRDCLQAGLHVICDKPLTVTSAEARELQALSQAQQRQLIVTYTYTGYPMLREMRERILRGDLGALRLVHVSYTQDWLATPLEQQGQKQASWRTDPAQAGAVGALGDIGVHAYNLSHFVTGQRPSSLSADLARLVPGRRLDDHAQVNCRYANGARGLIVASQVAVGRENSLRVQVVGEHAALEWVHEQANLLQWSPLGQPGQTLSRGGPGCGDDVRRLSRVPSGHPEGYLEAFAALYRDAAELIQHGTPCPVLPTVDEALHDQLFIEACLRSSAEDSRWVRL